MGDFYAYWLKTGGVPKDSHVYILHHQWYVVDLTLSITNRQKHTFNIG